jgi:D-serine deaminase-like pyridoxal phosphate-dependent protein
MPSVSLDQLETPAVIVDHDVLLGNIAWAQQLAVRHGLALRPHVKTHKCFEIARLQLAAGAVGLTASKPDEALTFIEAGFTSVTVAYPVVTLPKVARLFAAARSRNAELRMIVDSTVGLDVLAAAAKETGYTPGVFIKIDVGLRRVGVSARGAELPELAGAIASRDLLTFLGLLSHAGHAYAASGQAEIRQIAREEARLLARARERVVARGIAVREVSVGSTPTALASDSYEGITELRPGNYVFMDRTPMRLGLIGAERVALSVIATVVSANDEFLILDAGSKVLSSDLGPHGTGSGDGFGLAFPVDRYRDDSGASVIQKLSEEHGFMRRPARPMKIGCKVRIIPNHSCAVVNLAGELVIARGDDVTERWRVAARGAVH